MNRQVFRVAGAGAKQVVPAFIRMHVEKHVCFEVADSAEVRQGGVDADDALMLGCCFCKTENVALARVVTLDSQLRE